MQPGMELLRPVQQHEESAQISKSPSEMRPSLLDLTHCWPAGEAGCAAAAADGRLDIVQTLRANDPGFRVDESACSAAAFHGHLPVLQWLCSQTPGQEPPWTESTIGAAASQGHAGVLIWLLDQQPPCDFHQRHPGRWPVNALEWLASRYPPSSLQHSAMFIQIAIHAATGRCKDIVEWATSIDTAFTLRIVRVLVYYECPSAVDFMHNIGCLDMGSELETELISRITWPAVMGDLARLREMRDVLIAHVAHYAAMIRAGAARTIFALAHVGKKASTI